MSFKTSELNLFFLPFFSQGHMIPMIDMARIFASHGVNVTIITTPLNALRFQKTIDRDVATGYHIQIHTFPLPYAEVGLPEGCENFNTITSPEISAKLFHAIILLQKPIERFLRESLPDCIVSVMFHPWTADLSVDLGIPRLVFGGSSFFSHCAADSVRRFKPHANVDSDTEPFVLPCLPDKIEMTKLKLPDWVRERNGYGYLMDKIKEAEMKSYGFLVNSIRELEPGYAEYYRKTVGKKAWHIGPVSLHNKKMEDKVERGNKDVVDTEKCLKWLDLKEPNSVLYISFGSMIRFGDSQLMEIASALEASGCSFIWVVRKVQSSSSPATAVEDTGYWLPEGFEERILGGEKGLIIRGWAPQMLILEHPATGGIMSHCGWNSILESLVSGLPMITWPVFAEQFYNEKLMTVVLRIGVEVGCEKWQTWDSEGQPDVVKREKIEKAVMNLMDKSSEEAVERRERVNELGEKATKALEEGGSSYRDMVGLIDELKMLSKNKNGV